MSSSKNLSSIQVVITVALLLFVSACNWVDSTGRQGNNNPTLSIGDGDVIAKMEEETVELDASASDNDGTVESYTWSSATEEGALQVCVNDIDLELAADSLNEACEDTDNCEILFLADEQQSGVFNVMMPKITAPVGLTHLLTVEDNDGGKTELQIHFCLDSLNEAPLAGDDQYSVVEGEVLVVEASSGEGLLSNDSDDKDVRNEALVVLGLADGAGPQHAEDFSLNADGGFTYSISSLTPFTVKQDSFSYEVSDGSHISQGLVTLDLSVEDDPPVAIGTILNQTATIGLAFGPLDVSNRFFDPERSELSFSATGLPDGIGISVKGNISGTPNISNSPGQYVVTVSASDGQNIVSHDPFTLTLKENSPPQLNSQLADQSATAGVAFNVDVSGHFSDPEGAVLTYSAAGLPDSLQMSSSGSIGGTPLDTEVGTYTVSVSASDSINETLMIFALEVKPNQAPVQSGLIPQQLATVGSSFSFDVSAYFSDPENDPLTFTAVGLPVSGSLTISANGLISGTPTAGDQTDLNGTTVIVTATDNHDNSVSGTFTLTIL